MIGTSVAGGRLFQRCLRHPSAGSLEYVSAPDSLVRLGSYRQAGGFPLMIVIAHGLERALADWRRDARLHLALSLSLGVAALLAWLGSRFSRKIRDHQKAERRYRLLADRSSDAILCVRLDERPLYVSPAFATLTGWHVASTARDWTRFVHPQGDSCPRAAAAIAHAVRRPGGLVARYGGEEFAVVLADTEASGAAEVAEGIRSAVQAPALEHAGKMSAAA